MRRIKLNVSYEGTDYCGWQVQPNGITVQQVLNDTLSKMLGEEIRTIGASRTDAGVHAMGNVAVFDTNSRMPGDKFAFALNTRLPDTIRIQGSQEVPPEFHPRFTDTIKTYEYKILNRKFQDPLRRKDSLFWHGPLDVERMQKAASYLVGEHDFKSFCSAATEAETTVRHIYDITVQKDNDMITIRVTGNGFLYNMIRIIAGTMIEIGRGIWEPEEVPNMLAALDRSASGPTAKACGLTLLEIRYPEWDM